MTVSRCCEMQGGELILVVSAGLRKSLSAATLAFRRPRAAPCSVIHARRCPLSSSSSCHAALSWRTIAFCGLSKGKEGGTVLVGGGQSSKVKHC